MSVLMREDIMKAMQEHFDAMRVLSDAAPWGGGLRGEAFGKHCDYQMKFCCLAAELGMSEFEALQHCAAAAEHRKVAE